MTEESHNSEGLLRISMEGIWNTSTEEEEEEEEAWKAGKHAHLTTKMKVNLVTNTKDTTL